MDTAKTRRRVGQNINVWVPDDLMEAFEELRAKTRRTTKAEIQVMLEKYLQEEGLWPRPGEKG